MRVLALLFLCLKLLQAKILYSTTVILGTTTVVPYNRTVTIHEAQTVTKTIDQTCYRVPERNAPGCRKEKQLFYFNSPIFIPNDFIAATPVLRNYLDLPSIPQLHQVLTFHATQPVPPVEFFALPPVMEAFDTYSDFSELEPSISEQDERRLFDLLVGEVTKTLTRTATKTSRGTETVTSSLNCKPRTDKFRACPLSVRLRVTSCDKISSKNVLRIGNVIDPDWFVSEFHVLVNSSTPGQTPRCLLEINVQSLTGRRVLSTDFSNKFVSFCNAEVSKCSVAGLEIDLCTSDFPVFEEKCSTHSVFEEKCSMNICGGCYGFVSASLEYEIVAISTKNLALVGDPRSGRVAQDADRCPSYQDPMDVISTPDPSTFLIG